MNGRDFIELSEINLSTNPFKHFSAPSFFKSIYSSMLLDWFETSAPWKLIEKDFYEQYEFSFLDTSLPDDLKWLIGVDSLAAVRVAIENIFGVSLSEKVDLNAHKLICGQTIRIHNDFIPGQESFRLVTQLNQRWEPDNGGFLLLFNSDDPSDVNKVVAPIDGSCLAFRISRDSNHAVSTIHSGERYTLVYSFYDE
ncbi:MAG: cyclophane-containing peptide 2OG-Fe(II) oxygenase YhhC [Pyrinomonadaceae bacterium]